MIMLNQNYLTLAFGKKNSERDQKKEKKSSARQIAGFTTTAYEVTEAATPSGSKRMQTSLCRVPPIWTSEIGTGGAGLALPGDILRTARALLPLLLTPCHRPSRTFHRQMKD